MRCGKPTRSLKLTLAHPGRAGAAGPCWQPDLCMGEDDERLRAAIEPYVEIRSIKSVRRGGKVVAIWVRTESAEGATKTVAHLNGTQLNGGVVNLKFAIEPAGLYDHGSGGAGPGVAEGEAGGDGAGY